MKKQIIYSLLALTTVCLGACNNNDEIDTANSIFSTEPLERNAFDYWLLDNYTYPYNIDFMYRMKDIESDHKYNLVPADYDKAVALSKIIKHVWMDAYVELAGMDFLRVYVPKTFHLIGSPAYESSGNMVLGTAEGGKKITLYNVNDLNIKKINIEKLNEYYFETMHHEFAHILHQKRNFDPSFNRISEGKYVGADWYYYMTAQWCHAPHGRCGLVRRFRDGLCHEPVQRGFCGKYSHVRHAYAGLLGQYDDGSRRIGRCHHQQEIHDCL